ncbi:beta-amylase [Striga asiatica]|uniref:Beta-amylase n=1 Tax=Striga asiatica TaxID=4170 RepID=A0A5A7PLS0_STRAF|nr:beta-amylase [Striga asiatica]
MDATHDCSRNPCLQLIIIAVEVIELHGPIQISIFFRQCWPPLSALSGGKRECGMTSSDKLLSLLIEACFALGGGEVKGDGGSVCRDEKTVVGGEAKGDGGSVGGDVKGAVGGEVKGEGGSVAGDEKSVVGGESNGMEVLLLEMRRVLLVERPSEMEVLLVEMRRKS